MLSRNGRVDEITTAAPGFFDQWPKGNKHSHMSCPLCPSFFHTESSFQACTRSYLIYAWSIWWWYVWLYVYIWYIMIYMYIYIYHWLFIDPSILLHISYISIYHHLNFAEKLQSTYSQGTKLKSLPEATSNSLSAKRTACGCKRSPQAKSK